MKKLLLAASAALTLCAASAHAAPHASLTNCGELSRLEASYKKLAKDTSALQERSKPHTVVERAYDLTMRATAAEYRARENVFQFLHLGHAPASLDEMWAVSYVVNKDVWDINLGVTKMTAETQDLYFSTMKGWCKKT